MSRLRPGKVLKGKVDGRLSGLKLQKALIVVQYTASIALIIASLIVYQQFRFIQSKELGYEKDHVLTISVFDRG